MNMHPTLAEVKVLIAQLTDSERAMRRPWILARFDVKGQALRPLEEA